MINVSFKNRELSKVELYKMTRGKSSISVKDMADGTTATPSTIVLFEKINDDTGEIVNLCSFDDTETGAIFVTQSTTFMSDLCDIESLMEGEPYTIVKRSGTTSAGRAFVYCELA